jgi:serine/threonine-protein kinase RsbW
MLENKKILIDESHRLFIKDGLMYKEFSSDFRQIRYYTLIIVQKAPIEIKGINLLEQQISELIKNAVKHGNRNDISKKIKVWYDFSNASARLVIEDEGEGFLGLEKWNEFNLQRNRCFSDQNFEEMAKYVSFRTEKSDDVDGGNALFAALEYWNSGIIFNNKKNSVAVERIFPKTIPGTEMDY